MKLISLNIWCGKVYEPLMQFVKDNSADTDIFCFQEILDNNTGKVEVEGFRANILEELKALLSDFNCYYAPRKNLFHISMTQKVYDIEEGSAIFVRKNIQVIDNNVVDILGTRFPQDVEDDFSNFPIPLQTVELNLNNETYFINNIHGISVPGDKLDTPKRLEQSQKIIDILSRQTGKKILVGDFNLMPDTTSVKILDKELKNLIKEFEIKDTRGAINRKQDYLDIQYFADYTFVSADIKVRDFSVPDAKISDHCPMVLTFE